MAHLNIYKASDDSVVSVAGTLTNAVEFTLRADLSETGEIRLYAMTDFGYETTSTVISFVDSEFRKDPGEAIRAKEGGDLAATLESWALASDNAGVPNVYGAYGASLSLGTVGNDAGKIYFWSKAKAETTEDALQDVSTAIKAEGIERAT